MHWYFAIDEAGSLGSTGAYAKTAVRTARMVGGLEPHLLYYGARNEFTAWMQRHFVKVIDYEPPFIETIRKAEAAGRYQAHSIGHWLRVGVPAVEREQDFVLYTDCDVLFLKQIELPKLKPAMFAAACAFRRNNWNYFNAGVMLMNVAAMRATYPAFETHICSRITDDDHYRYDDEYALNEFYRRQWQRLDPVFNCKPYWEFDSRAALLHFHGPKLDFIEAMVMEEGHRLASQQLGKMLDAHIENYIRWLQNLGDRLQLFDVGLALRMHLAASGLFRRREKIAAHLVDVGFMDFQMFPE